jgi:hypothetical protein
MAECDRHFAALAFLQSMQAAPGQNGQEQNDKDQKFDRIAQYRKKRQGY